MLIQRTFEGTLVNSLVNVQLHKAYVTGFYENTFDKNGH